MTVAPGSEQHALLVLDQQVMHEGECVGIVLEVRHSIPNGRRYAFVQPPAPEAPERRLPLDELQLWDDEINKRLKRGIQG